MTVPGVLRPSKAPRWGPDACAGSFALEARYPDEKDIPEAREGTAGHHYVMEGLQGRVHPVGTLAPNGHPIDASMVEYGALYIEEVRREWRGLLAVDQRATCKIETKVTAHKLVHPDNEGTPDTFILSLAAKRLVLLDYKYGHKYVDPFENWQCVNYIAGVFEAYELSYGDVVDMAITITIVQPRNYHPDGQVRSWTTTGAHIWSLIERLSSAAYAAKADGALVVTGSHCRDCNARHACAAFAKVAAASLDIANEQVAWELPPAAVGQELTRIATAMKRLEARRDGLTEQSLALIRKGTDVPGWGMGFVNSQERWARPVEEVELLGDAFGVELRKPGTVTPAQARKLGIDETVIAAYAEKPSGAAKLVPVTGDTARKIFT